MPRILNLLLFMSLCFIACNNDSAKHEEQLSAATSTHQYKRYTGTIAGQQVVVNMYFYKDDSATVPMVTGNYYYKDKSQTIDLSADGNKGNEIHLTEYLATDREAGEDKPHPEWVITIDNAGIKGKWYSGNRNATSDIALQENYDGAYRFDIIDSFESVTVQGRQAKYEMSSQYEFSLPSSKMNKDDADFITQAMLREISDSPVANNITDFIASNNKRSFAEYKDAIAEMIKDSVESESNNHYFAMTSLCVYNDKGLLVLNLHQDAYTGGAHGNTMSTYLCVDVKEKKIWRLQDILNVDTLKLTAMLETETRASFKIKPGAPLNETLLVDTIPLTGNVAISDKGLTFHYNAYEIACYAEGQVALYLPYTRLKEMLKPEFKKRMGLE